MLSRKVLSLTKLKGMNRNPSAISWHYCPDLIGKPLTCLKTSTFFRDLYHSFPIIAVECKLVVFRSRYFFFTILVVVAPELVIRVPETRTTSICKMTIENLILAIRRASADHDTQACCLGLTLSYFVSTFLSWVVYCGYTRSRGCLWSARLTQMWPSSDREQSQWLFMNCN